MQQTVIPHYDWISNHALRRPDALAAIDLGTEARFSNHEFHQRIDAIASWLADEFNIRTGDRVAVLALAAVDVFTIQFACFRPGAIFVPLT